MSQPSTIIGWSSAIISCVSFGSFAVPIKSQQCRSLGFIDPLVFQSYKVFCCLITAPLIIWSFGTPNNASNKELHFTYWGIVSGLFWVPSGIAAVYAVQNAGLALAQGTWSSLIVIVSFFWGIFIFEEKIFSIGETCVGVFCLICGLLGMSYFSSSSSSSVQQTMATTQQQYSNLNRDLSKESLNDPSENLMVVEHAVTMKDNDNYDNCISYESELELQEQRQPFKLENDDKEDETDNVLASFNTVKSEIRSDNEKTECTCSHESNTFITWKFTPRQKGISASIFNGVYGGSVLIPMHYAKNENVKGLKFVFSFAVGSSLVTLLIWFFLFCYHVICTKSFMQGYRKLPSLHFRFRQGLILPGFTAGLLWSLGNVMSMICVNNLGEAIGYSVVQSSLLISGLWGIFYYKEVSGREVIAKWFLSAMIAFVGILILSRQSRSE